MGGGHLHWYVMPQEQRGKTKSAPVTAESSFVTNVTGLFGATSALDSYDFAGDAIGNSDAPIRMTNRSVQTRLPASSLAQVLRLAA